MAEKVRKDVKRKRGRKRKARTDVEVSSSSSDSESDVSEEAKEPTSNGDKHNVEMADQNSSESEEEAVLQVKQPVQKSFSEADFNSWYLRQITKELEGDLDKIRSASDFKDSSLPVLITALQQGAALFSTEEKQRLLGTTS